jgi:hypothetical protein
MLSVFDACRRGAEGKAGGMNQEEDEIIEAIAARAWEIESGDLMIPVMESRKRWANHKAMQTHKYLEFRHNAITFLCAARDLKVVRGG